jgi:hypothetical protein
MSKQDTFVGEDLQDRKQTYINQPCPLCTVNHDYKFKGRIIECICGAFIKESLEKKGRLVRVG